MDPSGSSGPASGLAEDTPRITMCGEWSPNISRALTVLVLSSQI